MMSGSELTFERIDEVLAGADLRTLVMCLFHHTADEIWLSERYAPGRDVKLVADADAGFPADVQVEIRAAARELLVRSPEPIVTDPDPGLFRRLMAHCLGEEVPEEYVPMMMARKGWQVVEVKPERRRRYTDQIDVAHADLIWTHPGTSTYYRNHAGQVRSPMPFRMVDHWHLTRHPDPDDRKDVRLPAHVLGARAGSRPATTLASSSSWFGASHSTYPLNS